ncbi:MAG: AAA family ATPase [Merdimonas faecis]|jgi:cytidylate kinase|uniref:cytidylate kinase-like family protein n=1 Tax=Merdimonas faecis TaxID=1653435 RepID=UPI003990420D
MKRIITIGREFGSGGRTIAKMTGEKLGIPVYDNELLTEIAKESGLAKEYISEKTEDTSLGSFIARGLSSAGNYRQVTLEEYLWQAQRKVILDLARKEPCIIVGRCADYILRDRDDCLKVFIYASMEKRAERIVSVYGDESEESPERRLRDKDKRRGAFYNYNTDMKWGDPHNYHICLDSGNLGLEACRDILCGEWERR